MDMKRYFSIATSTALTLLLPLATLAQDTSLQPPFGSADQQTQPIIIIAVVIQALLGLVGAGALLMFIWGGFHMIFSAGSEERVTKGKKILIWAVIGMVVILSSYAVLSFTFDIFQTATGG